MRCLPLSEVQAPGKAGSLGHPCKTAAGMTRESSKKVGWVGLTWGTGNIKPTSQRIIDVTPPPCVVVDGLPWPYWLKH